MKRCEVTELLVDQCAHCLNHKDADEEESEEFTEMVQSLQRFNPTARR